MPRLGPSLAINHWRARPPVSADITTLIATLAAAGITVTALYDVRTGLTVNGGVVDSWAESRGRAPALIGSGTARPASDASGLTFDGVDDFLRGTGAFGVTGHCAAVMVMKGQTSIVGRALELSVGATGSTIASAQAAGPTWTTNALAGAAMLANAASPQILHSRFKAATEYGTKVGAAVEVTAVTAAAAATPDRLTLGANRLDAPSSFAPVVGLRAVLILAGDYTAQQATVNTWAVANHGAVA